MDTAHTRLGVKFEGLVSDPGYLHGAVEMVGEEHHHDQEEDVENWQEPNQQSGNNNRVDCLQQSVEGSL